MLTDPTQVGGHSMNCPSIDRDGWHVAASAQPYLLLVPVTHDLIDEL